MLPSTAASVASSGVTSPPRTGKPRKIKSRAQMLQKFRDELNATKPKTPPKALPDIPETSLHTELLYRMLDTKDKKGIRELVKLSGPSILAGHDWLHFRGRTPMHRAVESEDLELVHLLAVELRGDVNVQDANRRTPAHLACRNGSTDVLRVLLEAADIDLRLGSNHRGHSPLHLCAVHGRPEMARLLLEAGAPINLRNEFGETALHLAAQYNQSTVAALLLDADADTSIATYEFRHTPLHYAAQCGSDEVAVMLQSVGCSVHVPERDGTRTALDLACSFGHHRLGGLLLKEERRKRETAETERRADEAEAALAKMEAERMAAKLRLLRARERVLARRAEERAQRKADEAERKRLDQEKAAQAQKAAMARVRRLAKAKKASVPL